MCVITGTLATLGTIASTVVSATSAAASAVGSAAAAVGSTLATAATTAGSTIASAAGSIGSSLASMGGSIMSGLETAGGLIASGAETAGGFIVSGAEATMDGIITAGETAWNAGTAAYAKTAETLASVPDVAWKVGAATATLAGGGVEAYGAIEEAKDNSANLKAQAANAEIQAQQTLDAAETEAKDLARKRRQAVGTGKAAAAANGVMLETRAESSPAMWEQDMAAEAAWDTTKLFHNANMTASTLYNQANINRNQARSVRRSGNLRAVSSLIKGGIGAMLTLKGNPSTTLNS